MSDNTEKLNSLKFKKNCKKIDNVNDIHIILQRFNRFKYLYLMFNSEKFLEKSNDEDDDYIIFSRKDKLGKEDLLILEDLEAVSVVSDKDFKDACLKAIKLSHKFARIFLIFEFITKICDLFLIVVIPIVNDFYFDETYIIILMVIMIPIILMQLICDWGKLLEKYSRLCWEFSKLKNSNDSNKFAEYEILVFHFKSSWIYTDMIIQTNDF